MNVLDFKITPANVNDSKIFIPLISGLLARGFEDLLKNCYGDNAYDTRANHDFCVANDIKASFHSKDETGKNPKKKRSARKKSRIRSKIETIFGISNHNMGFGSVRVRTLPNVIIDTSLIFIAWNLGILYTYYINRFEDRISLKQLLYKN